MSENKYDTLLNISIVILGIAAVMLSISGYNIFSEKRAPAPVVKASNMRDSLQKVYSSTLKSLDNNLQFADAAGTDKDDLAKLAQMRTLRTEIDSLLKQQGSEADLATAKIKIAELQQKVAELQNSYTNVAGENKRLQALLNRLIAAGTPVRPEVAAEGARPVAEKPVYAGRPASVDGMHLFATAGVDTEEQETTDADAAEKIVGSFWLKNIPVKGNGEVVVILLQPDGRVVKNSVWESGTFETKEGKKVYSRKLYFEPSGDEKLLNFSLTPERFIKGNYTMQVWYNGSMMGKLVRTLS